MKVAKKNWWTRLGRSVWLFPVLLAIPFIVLTAFRISGTSSGEYHQVIYGPGAKDPNLLFGHPQPIRSDEWLVDTQLALAQRAAGYPKVNNNLGTGIDMAIQGDAPYKDWSALFKAQNFSFFIMPFDYAFAFKWWLLLYSVIVSCYFFTLRIVKNRRLFAAIFSTAVGLSPFFFWWYLSGTFLPVTYGFLMLIVGMRIIKGEPVSFLRKARFRWSALTYALVFGYLLVSFGLLLYPPYQIPIAIATVFFLIGYFAKQLSKNKSARKATWARLSIFFAGVLIAAALGGLFYAQNKAAIHSLENTAYPGVRLSTSGGINYLNIFDSFMQPQLESTVRGTHFFNNQSEASNFILLSPFLVVPALALIAYEYKKYRKMDWLFIAVLLCALMFFARVFLPYGDKFYTLLLLDRVPNPRLIMGIGFIGIILTLLIVKKLQAFKLPAKWLLPTALIYSAICFAIVFRIGVHTSHSYPLFMSYLPKIILLSGGFCAIIFLFLANRIILASSFLFLFSLGSVIYIHPLYRGLGWIENNNVYTSMRNMSAPHSRWAAADLIITENLPALANRDSISGVKLYPDLNFWRQADARNQDIYNRYAQVVFVSNPSWNSQLYLVQPDFFEVNLNCSDFIKNNIDYVVDTTLFHKPCMTLENQVSYPAATFYMYKVIKS